MCGRISCHLCKPDYRRAASYYDDSQNCFIQPDWVEASNNGLTYSPSTNMAPTEVLPVLIDKEHEMSDINLSKRVIKPMMWGMIPPWHKGEYKSHGLSTNNCRIEGLLSSRLYNKPLQNGQRCVIGCQGFYEWQTTKPKGHPKQPYFIKASQTLENGPVEQLDSWVNGTWNEVHGWKGPQLLMMAGLFDMWKSSEGEEIFSFTIITMEANKSFAWLHHRIPAILHNEELINNWLDHNKVPGLVALKLLQPCESLTWHPVSTSVNNARNKDNICNKPFDLRKPTNKIMDSWLKRPATSNLDSKSKQTKDS